MIFYVYLDPQIISTAQKNGNLGVQALTGILHALSQNCFLAEFNNYSYTQEEIGEQLKNIVGDFDIIALKKVLAYFAKERMFVECLDYDYSGITEAEMAQAQAANKLLDLLLLSDTAVNIPDVAGETATLENYQSTHFESERSRAAVSGISLPAASLDGNEFLETHLKKGLQYASTIEIYDYLCGEKYKSNYAYTLKHLLSWLENISQADLSITIHCGYPDEQLDLFENGELDGLNLSEKEIRKEEKLSEALKVFYGKSAIKVVCYDSKFAHDRFIITNQTAFSIGIGMDFLHHTGANKGKIRDISINLKDAKDVRNLISGVM